MFMQPIIFQFIHRLWFKAHPEDAPEQSPQRASGEAAEHPHPWLSAAPGSIAILRNPHIILTNSI